MTFVSFAQNFEDLMLWRALKNIENGFYVDVGANDPTELSITRAFYDKGWHGINIEPVDSYYQRLCAERLRDINLNIAIGASEGQVTFYEIPDTALSTTDAALAAKHKADGLAVKEIIVPMQTLTQVLQAQAHDVTIHFMNIDVEGGEADVLSGMDFSRWRPWIILLESTTPATDIPDFQEWQDILLSNGYEFVYFDALNRFYLAKEHIELAQHFKLPPNLFDKVVFARELLTQQKTQQKIASLEQELLTKEQQLAAKEEVIQRFRASFRYMLKYGPIRNTTIKSKMYNWVADHFPWIRPQLGVLHQYPPRPAQLPARYFRVEKLIQPAPKISIVTPTYNYAHFLERTINSVINQKYVNLEYIVQDGGSTDGTVELVERFKAYLKHFESRRDNGQTHAINLGFRHATGEIMAYLNSDDVLLPSTLDYVANYFTTHPNVDVVYGHRLIIDEHDQVIGDWIMPPHDDQALRWADYVPQETLFWRKRIWEKVGGQLDESFHFAMDWDLLLRFQQAGAVFERLPRYLAAFRVHEQQKTSAQMANVGEKDVAQLRMRTFGRPVDYQEINSHIRSFLRRSIWYRFTHKMKIRKDRWLAQLYKEDSATLWDKAESIYFYSLHKAGTALFTHVLRQANKLIHVDYETMLFDNQLPETVSYQKYGHLYGVFRIVDDKDTIPYIKLIEHISTKQFVKDKIIIFLVRDPRDILISFYYSMGESHVSSANPEIEKLLQSSRNNIQTVDLDGFVLSNSRAVAQRFEIIYELSKACKHSVILKYEDLLNNFDGFMQDFEKYISIPKERKQELFNASRPREDENLSAHKRSGKVGQYKEKLKPETIREINQTLKPVLENFGYDIDEIE